MYGYQQQQQQPQIIGALTTHGGYHPYVVGTSTHGNAHSGFLSQAVPLSTATAGASAGAGATTAVRSGGAVAQPQLVGQTSYVGQPFIYGGQYGAQPFVGGQQFGQQSTGVPVLSSAPTYALGQQGGFRGLPQQSFPGSYAAGSYVGGGGYGGIGSYYGAGAGSYGHPGQQVRAPEAPNYNKGYFYDDYIHDRHSPRRSYAAFRDARMPVPEGDIIYRHTIRRDDDFVLPRRSPRSEALEKQQQQQFQQNQQQATGAAPQQQQQQQQQGPATIEVVEAKDLPTSILDKTDPYVRISIAGRQFSTTHKEDAGKAARWNESFTLETGVRTGAEGIIEIRDKDTLKDDSIASSNFFLENGDRWFTLKPKGQVRLNVRGVPN